jgi:hypothetical protein
VRLGTLPVVALELASDGRSLYALVPLSLAIGLEEAPSCGPTPLEAASAGCVLEQISQPRLRPSAFTPTPPIEETVIK